MKCDFCGKEFEPEGNRNLTRRRFCSKKCRNDFWYYRESKPESKRVLKRAEPRTCTECGKVFTPDANHHFAQRCSPECNMVYQNRVYAERRRAITEATLKISRICGFCEKEYLPQSLQQEYCSDECRRQSRNRGHRETARQVPRSVKTERNAKRRLDGNWLKAIERDRYTCQICLSEGTNVHHMNAEGEKKHGKRQKDDSRLENLLTLCDQCHKDMHGVFLICKDGKWYVEGKIFDKIGMYGTIEILNKPEQH
jgi:5-methylcytosine-specific restriction endonuclease McrA